MSYGQDPFFALLSNKKIDAAYWTSKSGAPSYGLQDNAVIALRKMGYQGALGDMLRAFYMNLTGISDLKTAWARANELVDTTRIINFVGKTNGNGDNTRLLKYGTFPTLVLPSQFISEALSGYAGAATEGGSTATWSSTTPVGSYCQFCSYFNLSANGNVASNIQNIRELKVQVRVVNCTVKVFNQRTGLWEDRFVASGIQTTTIEMNDGNLSDYLGTDNTIKVGVIANDAATGADPSSKALMDFIEVQIKSLK